MKINKLILFVMFSIVVIPLISATIFEQNSDIDWKKSCTKYDELCNASASCNVTMKFPNQTYVVDNGVMTNQNNGDFNYSLTSSQTNVRGTYIWDMYCCQLSNCGEAHGTFDINPPGENLSTGQSILYLILLLVVFSIFGFCLYGAIKIPWKHSRSEEGFIVGINNKKIYKIGAWVFSYFTLMWTFALLRALSGYFLMEATTSYFRYFYYIMMALAYPLLIVSVVIGFIVIITNLKLEKQLTRGFEVR